MRNHAKEGFTFDDEGLGPRSERADQVLWPSGRFELDHWKTLAQAISERIGDEVEGGESECV